MEDSSSGPEGSSSGPDIEEYFGYEQPSFIEQIKTILDEYRNDVQIIKELVQNADDAEATTLKILYEGRNINEEQVVETKYRKFFRAPALVFYNDKTFSDDDWRGIRSIYKSVKVDDPLKIGKFGLGFKSVFHLTDNPCIISGSTVLLINPHEKDPCKIFAKVSLKDIRRLEKEIFNEFMKAFDGTFGFSEKNIETGDYQGTLFWFPLRQKPSELSENVYKESDVAGLLQAFINESQRSLLFLKTLCNVEIFVSISALALTAETLQRHQQKISFERDSRMDLEQINFGKDQSFYSVKIDNSSEDLVFERAKRLKELKENGDNIPQISKKWADNVYLTVISKRQFEENIISKSRWLVVNYLKGGELSQRMQELRKDKSLAYPHLVGLAAPILENSDYISTAGHVFCFQPLPQESSSVTGLPVHVNAYFALSQNRRHIRWPDEDSLSFVSQDKKIEWNIRIISEIFPEAYFQTILEMVKLSKREGNKDCLVQAVYNTIPDLEVVQCHWKDLANNILTMCKQNKAEIFHAECNGNWLPAEKAVIADPVPYNNLSKSCFDTVLDLLEKDKVEICKVPQHVIKAYKQVLPEIEISFVTPMFLRRHLTQNNTYMHLPSNCKLNMFEFILQELSTNNLEHIKLVPLADNTFCKLSTSNSVFKEEKEIIDLFPRQESRFLSPELPQELSKLIGKFKSSNKQYFLTLNASDTREMLKKVVSRNFRDPPLVHGFAANKWKSWIQGVWNMIQIRFGNDLIVFSDLQIFPVLFDYPWETAEEFRLLDLKSHILHVPYFREDEYEVQVQEAFASLSVTVVKHIPNWIQQGFLDEYIHNDAEGLTQMLSCITDEGIQNYNRKCTWEISQALLVFFSTRLHRNIAVCKHRLAKLKLFRGYTDARNFELESVSENPKVYNHTSIPVFPVRFPYKVILMDSQSQETLANKLGAQLISDVQLSIDALKIFDKYSEEEKSKLVKWIIHQNAVFADVSVRNALKNIRFLKSAEGNYHKPSQLFDPTDKDLKKLFYDRPVFPVFGVNDDIYMKALKQLGLKNKDDLTCGDIFELCDIVHEMTTGETRFDADRCNTLLQVMNGKSSLVQKERIASKRCILPNPEASLTCSPGKNKEVDKTCLKCPTEIRSKRYEQLIGSVLLTIDERAFPQLSDTFGWTKPPDVDDVLKHLCNVVRTYDVKRKADILPIIIKVYSFLKDQDQLSAYQLRNKCNMVFSSQGGRYIWIGDGFQPPEKVYVHKMESDIDMTPFLFELPNELKELADVFLKLGCSANIGVYKHIETLEKIKSVCESSKTELICSERRLLSLSIAILNKLKEDHLDDIEKLTDRVIYFPVQTNRDFMKLASSKRCFYIDAPWLQDMIEDDMAEIHPDVPVATAEALGVQSLHQHLLSNTQAIEQWGQEEPLTRQIKMILKGYTDGFSIVKEFFQNADDAGAKKMWILYDERENDDAKTNLLSENMAICQGPAIWIFNDGKFTENDLKNITKLGGATKEDDSTKIGKFGLGFCAVYNLTDVPSFISGENLVIFDPLTTHLGKSLTEKSPGMRINFGLMKNRKMLQKMKNQFKPFEGIFGCRMFDCSPNFEGTLFRVPLRKKPSDISETVYSHNDVLDFIKLTINLSSNLFLFNHNVQEFKIFHLPENSLPLNMRLLFEVTKTISNLEHFSSLTQPIVERANEMKRLHRLKKPLFLLQKNTISGTRYNDSPLQTETYTNTWLISWATGEGEHILRMTEAEKGSLCLGSIAVPIEQLNIEEKSLTNIKILHLDKVNTAFFRKGHVFCYLPLPIEHNFPFHINGQFCVSPDRRHLSSSTEDDRKTEIKNWNECLLSDSVVNSLLFLLVNVRKLGNLTDYKFDQLWPRSESGQHLQCVTDSFYRHVVRPGVFEVFERDGVWFDITKCLFLRSTFRKSITGDYAFAALSMLTLNAVDICEDQYQLLQRADSKLIEEQTVTEEAFFLYYFFLNLGNFDDNKDFKGRRNDLLLYAIRQNNSAIEKWLKDNPCVPSMTRGVLKRPNELIDPKSQLACLFEEDDIWFPSKDFASTEICERLRNLGLLCDILPDFLVVDRAKSVKDLKKRCGICAATRSNHLLMYISRNISHHEICFQELKKVSFVPVMSQPQKWPFIWQGISNDTIVTENCKKHSNTLEQCHFERASDIYHSDCKYLVGCLRFVFDDMHCSIKHITLSADLEMLLQRIGMKGIPLSTVEPELVMNQLALVINSPVTRETQTEFTTAVKCIYKYLDEQCKNMATLENIRTCLGGKKSVWVSDRFVLMDYVAKCGPNDCQPYFYNIEKSPLCDFPHLTKCMNIVDHFSPKLVGIAIMDIKKEKRNMPLCVNEEQIVINLLNCLEKSLDAFNINVLEEILDDDLPCIYAPDENGYLQDCKMMCFNDFDNMEKSQAMIYSSTHITPQLAKVLGIQPKAIFNLEKHSENIEDFYQEEPLVTRLKRLVDGYHGDCGIFKELIQNADDAGASEIHFLLDERIHPCFNIMNKEFKPLQGPALCVFNNSAFSNCDLDGIKRLGVGSKRDDPSKTGKYGVGFNSVYSITDAPSFYTKGGDIENGETICFFDPLAKFLPNVTRKRPGKRYKNVRDIKRNHSNVLNGFHETFFMKTSEERGTIFRFPLRTKEMAATSEIKTEPTNVEDISQELDNFILEAKEIMIFLKNLHTIRISKTFAKGRKQIYHEVVRFDIHISKTYQRKKSKFVTDRLRLCSQAKSSKETIFNNEQSSYLYEFELTEKKLWPQKEHSSTVTKYSVIQMLGFKEKDNIPQVLKQSVLSGSTGSMPQGAVAYRSSILNDGKIRIPQTNDCKAFCFLPLPNETGLPFHIHGNFALDHEIRRSLFRSPDKDMCPKTLWNSTLIRQVIAPAYVQMLEHMKASMFSAFANKSSLLVLVSNSVRHFQNLFPSKDNLSDEYWKELLKCVYQELVFEKIPFLPVLRTTGKKSDFSDIPTKLTELSWTPLQVNDSEFPAYCMAESGIQCSSTAKSDFNNLLREIGMRLVVCDDNTLSGMKFAGTAIEPLEPKHVIECLASFSSDAKGKCSVQVLKHIEQTAIRSIWNLKRIFDFCLEDTERFVSNMHKLPIFLTQDCVLRALVEGEVLFVEPTAHLCDLFTSKFKMFLHASLSSSISDKVSDYEKKSLGCLKQFTLSDFAILAKDTDTVITQVSKNVIWNKTEASMNYVKKFWKYFMHLISDKDEEFVTSAFDVIGNIALIPGKESHIQYILVPPSNRKSLLNTKSFSNNEQLQSVAIGLKLPELDEFAFEAEEAISVVEGQRQKPGAYEILLNYIPRFSSALEVLECFYLNMNVIASTKISAGDACCILRYFNEYLPLKNLLPESKEMLISLNFFLSLSGNVVAIKGYDKTFAISNDLPKVGLKALTSKAKVLFLCEIGCTALYNKLGILTLDIERAYTEFIIPMQDNMTRTDFYNHIQFLAHHISTNMLPDENNIIEALQSVKFVEATNKAMFAVSDLFHPKFKLFKLMCKDYELVPVELREDKIFDFLKKLGLKVEMDLSLFIRFANEIESSRSCKVIVNKQSTRLVKELFKMEEKFFKKEDLTTLSAIRFVLPLETSSKMSSIHPQIDRGRFIKFKGSVLSSRQYQCWTVSNILSSFADPTKQESELKSLLIIKALQIERTPRVEDLLKHFRNVSESVNKNVVSGQPIDHSTVLLAMKEIYSTLEEYREMGKLAEDLLRQFYDKPTIYLPNVQQFLLASTIVIECTDEETIPPFLNKCPTEFYSLNNLLFLFGARKRVSVAAYASVLRKLKNHCDISGRLLPKERVDGSKAMGQFFNLLSQSSCPINISSEDLYLISTDFKLEKARDFVVINNEAYLSKIPEQNREAILFLMDCTDFKNYRFKRDNFIESLDNLPENCRPHLLTDIIEDRIDLSHIQLNGVAPAKQLEEFFHGAPFFNAIIRLVRNAFKENKARWTDDDERKIALHIGKITCKHVTGIQTVLELKIIRNQQIEQRITIENKYKKTHVHIEKSEENDCIYFDTEYHKWIEDVQSQFSVHLNKLFEHRLKDEHLMILREIIGMSREPDRISEILGDAGVPEYDSSIEIMKPPTYPTPGQFVPREMHCYLDNDYGLFYHYDYKFIALELNDPAFDVDDNEFQARESVNAPGDLESTYIFVHILEKETTENIQPLLQEYKVDDGSGNPRIVKAFQLFKFIARSERKHTENRLIIYERTPTRDRVSDRNNTITVKQALSEVRIYLIEAWQQSVDVRRRIVKRLMLKWHPDKNPDNVAMCTEVFQYIQLCLERLERGLDLPENNDGDTNGGIRPPSSTWDWENSWYRQYWERRQRYRRTEEHQSDDEYPQARPKSEHEPYHWYAEGRRWQRQAVSDLDNSRASMQENTGYTFNWVCYKAHQAAEKSLKAAWYAKDANQICSVQYSHDIVSIASGLGSELTTLSRQLSDLTGDHTRMRYPDALRGQQIPAEAYTRQTAETVIQLAEQILQKVQSDYLN